MRVLLRRLLALNQGVSIYYGVPSIQEDTWSGRQARGSLTVSALDHVLDTLLFSQRRLPPSLRFAFSLPCRLFLWHFFVRLLHIPLRSSSACCLSLILRIGFTQMHFFWRFNILFLTIFHILVLFLLAGSSFVVNIGDGLIIFGAHLNIFFCESFSSLLDDLFALIIILVRRGSIVTFGALVLALTCNLFAFVLTGLSQFFTDGVHDYFTAFSRKYLNFEI